MKKITVLPLALALIAAPSCKQTAETENGPVEIDAMTLKDTTCVVSYSFPATLTGVNDLAVYPQVSGRLTRVLVKSGQFVKAGQILMEIDDVPYRAAYDQALAAVEVSKAQVETARITLESKQNLFDKEIISEYQLNLAKNELTTAIAVLGQSEAALKNASNELSFTKVKTDISGYVGDLPYDVGSLVGSNITKPLTIISDNSKVDAKFSIQENIYLFIASIYDAEDAKLREKEITLIANNGVEYPHKGRVVHANGMLSQATGALPITAEFPNPDGLLLSGGSCQVVLNTEIPNTILVPRSSIKEIQDKMFVYKIENGVIEQVPVTAERFDNNYWMLLPEKDGSLPLKSGDKVSLTTNRLQNGMEVKIK